MLRVPEAAPRPPPRPRPPRTGSAAPSTAGASDEFESARAVHVLLMDEENPGFTMHIDAHETG